jgi:hypothetical protein
MNTPSLGYLIWIAVLLGWSVLTLDWRDEVIKMRPERVRIEQLRAKEQAALSNVDWQGSLRDAQAAKSQWLTRLPRVEQTGVFRAQALETISDMCKQIEVNCQVSSLGENIGIPDKNSAEGIAGVITTGVRVSLPLQGNKLELMMKTLENDVILRRIDKITARTGRVTLEVQNFGLDVRAAPSAIADAPGAAASASRREQLP